MRRLRFSTFIALVAVLGLIAAACSDDSGTGATSQTPSGAVVTAACDSVDASAQDALGKICSNGELRVATDQKYKPQSWFDAKDETWKGFDVDVANEIARRLGVTAAIEHHDWETEVTAGSWNDRWDVSVGSMTDTVAREKIFTFTPAYYFTPAGFAVHADNTSVTDVTKDLDGKKICVGAATTYEDYLNGDLVLGAGAPPFDFVVDNAQVVSFTTDTDALDALALGDGVRCDAAMTATPTTQAYVDSGGAVKSVGEPIYFEPLSVAFDKRSPVDNATLAAAVSDIVTAMHDDGTLTALSQQWYGEDLTT